MEIIGEKADAYYTYKGNKGYMPMVGFLYELKLCIYDEFREGNTAPAFGQRDFYRECKRRLPKGKRIGNYRVVKKLPLNLHREDIFKFYIGI